MKIFSQEINQILTKYSVWCLLGIFLIGLGLRKSIYNLEPLFMDAAYYASLGLSIADGDYLLQVNHMSDKPPLFFYIQGLFFKLFGVSESIAVLPSFLGGIISIFIMYLLGRDLKNKITGLLAAFCYSISPACVQLSTMGLIESLFMAITLLSFWTLFRRRYYWSGFLIGVSFGMKQTVLAFGPLYLICLIIIAVHYHTLKDAVFSFSKSILKMLPGFLSVFIPIFYWGVFLTSERMKFFKYISGFVSGGHDPKFIGDSVVRLSSLQKDLNELLGLSWYWIIGLLIISIILFFGKIYQKVRSNNKIKLSEKIHFCINIFTLLFFFLLIFVSRKYLGIWYVFPIFPFLILTGSITLVELLNTRFFSWKRNVIDKIIISVFGTITLFILLSSATSRVNQIRDDLKNAPYQGAQKVIKEIKHFLLDRDSVFFEQDLGWMLRYYLFGEKFRNLHYDFGDQNMVNMKQVLFKEPYTNFYLLVYRPRYSDIDQIKQTLSPEFRVDEIFRNKIDNFRFFKIDSIFPKYNYNLSENWGKKWENWWYNILTKKWIGAKNIEITNQFNKTKESIEINLVAKEVPFKDLVVSKMQVSILSPKLSVSHSLFYEWPVFQNHHGIKMKLIVDTKTMEKSIKKRFNQVKKIQFSIDPSLINVRSIGQVNEFPLEINTDVNLKLERDYVSIDIQKFFINGWELTGLTDLFKNHLIPPLKVIKFPLMDLKLVNVEHQRGMLIFDYLSPARIIR